MATQVIMPKLGLIMTEGTIATWVKREGESVEEGERLFDVETDKTVTEVGSPAKGVLAKILVEEGLTVPITTVVAIIAQPGERLQEAAAGASVSAKVEESSTASSVEPRYERGEGIRRISPAARRLARERGVDSEELLGIEGTGTDGRVTERDVLAYLEQGGKHDAEGSGTTADGGRCRRILPLSGMRKTIFERMGESKRTAAHVTLSSEVDMTEAVQLRGQLIGERADAGPRDDRRLSYTSLVVKAAAKAVPQHPFINCRLVDNGIEILGDVNIGVAVAVEDGLIVPVVRHADRMTLFEIGERLHELIARARARDLGPEDTSGGTFTVTNLGMYGVDVFTPVINPPECAILGVGRIAEKLSVWNREVTRRKMMYLSLSFDHRLINGVPAAKFLQTVKDLLEHPYKLLL